MGMGRNRLNWGGGETDGTRVILYVTNITSTALELNQSLQCDEATSHSSAYRMLVLCLCMFVRSAPVFILCEHTFGSFKHFILDRQTEINISFIFPFLLTVYRVADRNPSEGNIQRTEAGLEVLNISRVIDLYPV
jgi:hypothetical protein